jgi:GABA permease
LSVRSYGEFEFWFASIKVAAIVAFILVAAGWLFGIGGGDSPGLSNLTAEGGFAPEGVITLLSGVVVVIFAFVGAEIVTIAAAESKQPEEAVAGAVRSVVYRVLLFYVLSVFLLVAVVPWNTVTSGESPFITALDAIGIPGAADVMNAIIVTAVLSCLNSGLYTGSRVLFALARRGDAPKGVLDVNSRGVPVKAILLTTAIGFLSTILAWLSPETVFLFLVNSSGAVALFVYLLIAVAELRMRSRLEREAPERLKVRMWLYPWLTWLSIAAIVVVIGSMALVDGTDSYLIPSFISLGVVVAAGFAKRRLERVRAGAPARLATRGRPHPARR